MLKLPINKIQTLLGSLDGVLVEFMGRFGYCLSWGRKIPMLSIATMKDITILPNNKINDVYHIYVLDLISCRVVGKKVSIHMEPSYDDKGNAHLLNKIEGLDFQYASNHKYAKYNQEFKVKHNNTPLPFGPGMIIPSYDDERYYLKEPYVKNTLLFINFIWSYLKNIRNKTNTPYEQWIVNYLSKLELLSLIHKDSSTIGRYSEGMHVYIKALHNVDYQVFDDWVALLDEYPIE